jgi:hypothetical protein
MHVLHHEFGLLTLVHLSFLVKFSFLSFSLNIELIRRLDFFYFFFKIILTSLACQSRLTQCTFISILNKNSIKYIIKISSFFFFFFSEETLRIPKFSLFRFKFFFVRPTVKRLSIE